MRFHRHMNHALGKEVHTKKEYLSEMKKMGLAPSNSPEAQPKKYPRREYKPSAWAHEMVRAIESATDKDGKVHLGSVALDQLQSNLKAVPKDLQNLKGKLKGGWR